MFEKVLLAVDGSKYSARAVPMAADIAKKSNGEVLVFRAREYLAGRGGSYQLEDLPDAERLVEKVKAEVAATGVKVSGSVEPALAGRIAKAIPQAGEGERAHAIVMGSRGLSDLGGLLLGSMTQGQVNHDSGRAVRPSPQWPEGPGAVPTVNAWLRPMTY